MGKGMLGKNAIILLYLLIIFVAGSWSLSQSLDISGIDERIKSADVDPAHFAQISEETQSQFRTEKGTPYIYAFDPYYFLAKAEKGEHDWNVFIILESLIYHKISADAVFYLPFVLGLLTLITFFFLAKRVTGSAEAAFFSGLLLALHHRFFTATAAGMADTQSINLLFSAVLFLVAFLAIDSKDRKLSASYSVLAIVIFVFFALTWRGAVYVPAVIALAVAAFFAIEWIKTKQIKKVIILAASTAAIAWLATLTGTGSWIFRQIFGAQSPLSRHIGELTGGSIGLLASTLGIIVLILSLIAVIIVVFRNFHNPDLKWLIVIVWFALMIFAAHQKIRFAYYALMPVSLLAGYSLNRIGYLFRVRNPLRSICAVLIILLMMIPPLLDAQKSAIPVMNDAIIDMGAAIDAQTSPDTHILSWWDYGHFWNYAAKREPYLDGRSKGVGELWWPRLWATARGFLSDNPEEAAMFWRLLMCTDRKELNEYVKAPKDIFCDANSIIMIDENMIDTAGTMIDVITSFDNNFVPGNVDLIDVEQCARNNGQVLCSSFTADLDTLTTNTEIPVHQFAQGERLVSEQTGQNIAIIYESRGEWYGFTASDWLAETMLIRLFAGENLFSPFATSDYPLRLAAYRFDISEENQ